MRALSLAAGSFVVVAAIAAACSSEPVEPTNGGGDAGSSSGGDGGGSSSGGGDAAGDAVVEGGGGADAGRTPCPAGMTDRFVCDAAKTSRVRCVDGFVQSVACGYGCTPGAGGAEATCSCGASTGFSHWNCGPDGDLHACAGGLAWQDRSCGGAGCDAAPVGTSDTCRIPASSLQATLASLGAKCSVASPGTTCGIAVRDLTTGEQARHRGTTPYVSASSAKALWVAAALYDTTIAAVQPHATPIFANSDNTETGLVIDLLASPDRVNGFTWQDVGVPDTGFCHWNYGKTRNATNCPSTLGGDNFFTANDMVSFLTVLWDRTLLGDAKSQAELDWMTLSPRSGYGGWLGTLLPAAARPKMHHKAGWLPPDVVPGYANSNDIGIVEIPGGHVYAVAILLDGAPDIGAYNGKQLPLLEKASCVVYHAIAKDVADAFAACGL
jgi:beta-lactamase class A